MKFMTSAEVRQAYLDYFVSKQHRHVPSSSLVPGDPTLLFANSGMVQFKDVFLGNEKRDYTRATTAQKCMRVSGKHNDLEEVGPSLRHNTFFEMLGNFSFGDYFKLEAMKFAWELVTEVYGFPADRLAVTIYEKDDESFALWADEVGVPVDRIARMGAKDNFWQMAETGPCGPNSEIFWDRNPELGEADIIASLQADDNRFLEFWNLVFMQFNRRQADPVHSGDFDDPLPSPGVDTGMGLERMTSIIQGVESVYGTDLFMPLIETTQRLAGTNDQQRNENIVPYRVIADHMRAAVFLIGDGVMPGAKGRDSVCRLVIRRAARFGSKLGFDKPFLGEVAQTVIDVMGGHYTELADRADAITSAITLEEERFRRTLDRGVSELNTMLEDLPDGGQLSGENAFYLKATLGLPIQVTQDIANESGYGVDMSGFETAEEEHAAVSGGGQAMGEVAAAESYSVLLNDLKQQGVLDKDGVIYDPYGELTRDAQVVGVLQDGQPVEQVIVGDKVELVLSETPFYVEAGGQVSDTGTISGDDWTVEVEAMRKPVDGLVVHIGEIVEGQPKFGDMAHAAINVERRSAILRNHTGTHLLHAALRNHLGTHVQQRGSLVAPDRLRFDFAHDSKVSADELRAIEAEVNAVILDNEPVHAEIKSLQQARDEGAMALFGEKYGDVVRTIVIGEGDDRYSYELCGGTHVRETAEIGAFVFTGEGSVSAGIRRVEALTGNAAIRYIQEQMQELNRVAGKLGTTPDQASARLEALQADLNSSKKQIEQLRRDLARFTFDELIEQMEEINGVPTLITQLDGVPMDTMREMSDWFRGKAKSGVFIAGSDIAGRPQLIAVVTDDWTKRGLHAGNIVRDVASIVGGGGGGRPTMAQAGGKDSGKLPEALEYARKLVAESVKD